MPCDGVLRCCEPIADEHLRRLAQFALPVFERLFDRRPDTSGRYRGRLLLLALCQGVAQHRVPMCEYGFEKREGGVAAQE